MDGWIMTLFGGSMALIVYFSIFAAGLTFSIFSLVFGGDADSDIDVDGHDGDFGSDHGDFDHGHGGDHEAHGPSVFSVRGVFLMMTGFGGTAFIAQHYSGKILFSSVVGIVSGWVFAGVLMLVMRAFYQQQSNSRLLTSDIVGSLGTVTLTIPGRGKLGEVKVNAAGHQLNRPATSVDGKKIQRGVRIRVAHSQGGVVEVEKV